MSSKADILYCNNLLLTEENDKLKKQLEEKESIIQKLMNYMNISDTKNIPIEGIV